MVWTLNPLNNQKKKVSKERKRGTDLASYAVNALPTTLEGQ